MGIFQSKPETKEEQERRRERENLNALWLEDLEDERLRKIAWGMSYHGVDCILKTYQCDNLIRCTVTLLYFYNHWEGTKDFLAKNYTDYIITNRLLVNEYRELNGFGGSKFDLSLNETFKFKIGRRDVETHVIQLAGKEFETGEDFQNFYKL